MIIGISGKIGSGKDTIGRIIQYLTCSAMGIQIEMKDWIDKPDYNNFRPDWQIVKFADALKDIVCILTGCTREQLEDEEFKNSKLSDEWKKERSVIDINGVNIDMSNAPKVAPTYRNILQYIGTDLLRNQLHENVWVNALFSKYKYNKDGFEIHNYYKSLGGHGIFIGNEDSDIKNKEKEVNAKLSNFINNSYPNWIITDVRFPNEAKAIKDRGGIIIRVNRDVYIENGVGFKFNPLFDNRPEHPSETALDEYIFDYVINNNSTINKLIKQVKDMLMFFNI